MIDKQHVASDLVQPIMVSDRESFLAMMAHLKKQPRIALDTESDSLFSYYAKVCLIQISAWGTDCIVDYLLDPLLYREIDELNTILADPNTEIIMHAAYNDILTLQREYEFTFRCIFDTQLTARILGWKRTGLASVLEEHFDVLSDKKMQRTNWGQRPLTTRQQLYAQMDTHYLFELRRLQFEQLEVKKRVEEAQEAFESLEKVNYHERPVQEKNFWQMRSAKSIPREKTGVLQALWQWREKTAQKMDRPPFKVINDAVLTEIAMATPKDQHTLRQVHGLSQYQVQRFGKSLLRTIQNSFDRPLPKLPAHRGRPQSMLDEKTMQCYEALRSWRTATAEVRGVDPDIVFSNDTLLAIAKRAPLSMTALLELTDVGPWKAKTYGPDLLQVLANV
ncbi:MAG: HRDC domain-containing protein [Chloroflexota bacterium]